MANIIVFGGDGFIGRHLGAALAKEQDANITVFSRFSTYKTGTEHPFEGLINVKVLPGDFSNRSDVAAALKGMDYVFHLISTTNPATSSNDPIMDMDTNVLYSLELLKACAAKKVKKVIFLSSGGTVYGDVNSDTIDENTVPQPRSPYGIGKITIEHYLRYFKHRFNLDSITYRVANPYGPGQNIYGKQGVIPIFMHSALTNAPITVYGDGSMVRDYIYIDDLVRMIALTYSKENQSEVYNLGSGTGVSVNELITAMERCTRLPFAKDYLDTPATFVHKSVLDISKFESEFGLTPEIGLEEGIERTWEYVKELK